MKLLFKKKLNEGMYKITQDILMCDYAGNVVNLMKNKPKEYRILYDGYVDVYLVGSADDCIHHQMLKKAITSGAYMPYKDKIEELENFAEDGFDTDLDSFDGYETTGQFGGETIDGKRVRFFLCYMIFSPDRTWKLLDDEYDHVYHLSFGDLLVRGIKLEIGCPDMYNAIKSYIESEEHTQGECRFV